LEASFPDDTHLAWFSCRHKGDDINHLLFFRLGYAGLCFLKKFNLCHASSFCPVWAVKKVSITTPNKKAPSKKRNSLFLFGAFTWPSTKIQWLFLY